MPARIRNSVLAGLLLVFATSLVAEVKVLKNFTLIDGTGHAPVPHAAMILNNGRIQWVGPASQLKAPAGAETTDLAGKYVMPGIINLHVHLGATIGLDQNEKFFTPENVGELMMVRNALAGSPRATSRATSSQPPPLPV